MKNTTLILAAFAATFAAASIYLGVQLGETREQLAEAEQGRADDQAHILQLEAEFQGLEAALASGDDTLPATPAAPPAPVPNRGDARKSADPVPPGAMPPPPTERRANVRDTPADRDNRRLQQEIRLRRRYAEMPAALGLDDSQADKLYDLLAEYRMAEYEGGRTYEGDRLGRQSVESATRQQRDAAIDALLGPDKAAEFQSFEKSIPARMQVSRIGESMAAANVPLSETQRKSMISAVVIEQEAGPPPERYIDGVRDPDFDARYLDWQADYSRRVQARVEPLLNSEQARQYRESLRMQDARRTEVRARLESRRNEGRQ